MTLNSLKNKPAQVTPRISIKVVYGRTKIHADTSGFLFISLKE